MTPIRALEVLARAARDPEPRGALYREIRASRPDANEHELRAALARTLELGAARIRDPHVRELVACLLALPSDGSIARAKLDDALAEVVVAHA